MLRIVFWLVLMSAFVLAQESPAPWLNTTPNTIAGYTQYVKPGQTVQQYMATARSYASRAEKTYPTPFADKPLWRGAILNAETAARLSSTNPEAIGLLAEIYTKTKWWSRAYLAWRTLRIHHKLSQQQREQAALSAAQVGYGYYRQGKMKIAIPYLEDSLEFKADPDVKKLLDRARVKAGG